MDIFAPANTGIMDNFVTKCEVEPWQVMLFSFLSFMAFGTPEGLLRYGICVPC